MMRPQIGRRSVELIVLVFIVVLVPFVEIEINAQENADTVTTVAWNSDGTSIAVGYLSGQLEVISASGQLQQNLVAYTDRITALAWHPTNNWLASGNADGIIHVWDVSTATSIRRYNAMTTITGVFWSNDGNQLWGISLDDPDNLFIWDTETGDLISSLATGSVWDPQWNEDRGLFLVGSPATVPLLIGVDNGTVIENYIGEPAFPTVMSGQTYSVMWAPGNALIAGGTPSGHVRIWDVATEQLVMDVGEENYDVLTWEQDVILDLKFTSDGQRIQAIDGSGVFRIWDIVRSELVLEEQLPVTSMPISAAEISPDGMRIAYGDQDGTLNIVELPSDNIPPEAAAGPDRSVTASSGGTASVTLDGSGSSDNDGTITAYRWYENDVLIAEGVTPQVELSVGEHTITLMVEDDDGATDSDDVIITVEPASG